MNKTLAAILKYSFFAAVGVASVWFAFRQINFDEFLDHLEHVNKAYVFATMLVGAFAVLLRGLRWNLMLRPLGYKPSNANAYHSVMSGYLINSLVPRAGEVSRCALMSRADNIPVQTLIGSVITERIIDLMMVVVVCAGATIWQADVLMAYMEEKMGMLGDKGASLGFYTVVFIAIVVTGFIVFGKIKHLGPVKKVSGFIRGLADGAKSIFRLKQRGLFMLYTLGIWACYWCTTQFTYFAFAETADAGWGKGLTTLVFSSIGVIIPAPGGVGAMPAVKYGLTTVYHTDPSLAGAFATVMVVSQALVMIICGSISFAWLSFKSKKNSNTEPVITASNV